MLNHQEVTFMMSKGFSSKSARKCIKQLFLGLMSFAYWKSFQSKVQTNIQHHLARFQLMTGYYIRVDLSSCAEACLRIYLTHPLLGRVVYYISAVKYTTAVVLVNRKFTHYGLFRNDAAFSFMQPTIFQSVGSLIRKLRK